jgi:hypothetical protein
MRVCGHDDNRKGLADAGLAGAPMGNDYLLVATGWLGEDFERGLWHQPMRRTRVSCGAWSVDPSVVVDLQQKHRSPLSSSPTGNRFRTDRLPNRKSPRRPTCPAFAQSVETIRNLAGPIGSRDMAIPPRGGRYPPPFWAKDTDPPSGAQAVRRCDQCSSLADSQSEQRSNLDGGQSQWSRGA